MRVESDMDVVCKVSTHVKHYLPALGTKLQSQIAALTDKDNMCSFKQQSSETMVSLFSCVFKTALLRCSNTGRDRQMQISVTMGCRRFPDNLMHTYTRDSMKIKTDFMLC